VTPHGVTHHIGMLVPRGQQSQNLTHPSVLEGRESPTYCRGLNRFHGQKNRPSVVRSIGILEHTHLVLSSLRDQLADELAALD
jgi:hypothetical protein